MPGASLRVPDVVLGVAVGVMGDAVCRARLGPGASPCAFRLAAATAPAEAPTVRAIAAMARQNRIHGMPVPLHRTHDGMKPPKRYIGITAVGQTQKRPPVYAGKHGAPAEPSSESGGYPGSAIRVPLHNSPQVL
jgi:hypothetical protein